MGGYSISETGYEKTQAGRGGGDAWLVKTDGDGNVEWDRTYGGDTLEEWRRTCARRWRCGGKSRLFTKTFKQI
jgi:hypothetical protein